MPGSRADWEKRLARLDDLILVIGQQLIQFFASKSEDLTMREIFLLETLGRRGSATMSELAQALAVPLTTMTSIVTRLVKKGYAERQRIEEDRRVVLVRLSASGEQLFQRHRREYIESVKSILGTLSDEEQHKLLALLGEVLTALSGNPG